MISIYKTLSLVLLTVVFVVLMAGCNDTLRQFIVPVPKPGGDPAALSHAIILSTNPAPLSNGSTMHIDVSGDTLVGVVTTGPTPVFLGKSAGRAYVINGNGTITTYIGLLPLSGTPHTVTQPGSTSGTVAGGTSSSSNFYPVNSGSNDVSLISSAVLAVIETITVGSQPVAIAGNAANSKMYVVNNGSDNVTVISTADNTVVKTIPLPAGSQPIWGVMANNGVQVFIVNQGNGTVSVIDTNLDAVIPCTPGPFCNAGNGAISVGASPNFAFYDSNRQRLYVSNTGSNTVSVIKADGIDLGVTPQILPGLLANVTLSGAPVSVTALADGSRAYAALGGCPAGINHTSLPGNLASCNGNQVSVIDAVGLRETKTIQVGPGAVSVDASSDSSRVYVVSAHDTTTIKDNNHNPGCSALPCTTTGGPCLVLPCLPGAPLPDRIFPTTPSVSVIRTNSDSVLRYTTDPSVSSLVPTFLAPAQDPACAPAIDANFNKTFPMPCVGQLPFMVRTFP